MKEVRGFLPVVGVAALLMLAGFCSHGAAAGGEFFAALGVITVGGYRMLKEEGK